MPPELEAVPAPEIQDIAAANQQQYNRHPYPGYPLWFRPHWQSGYVGASWFCQALQPARNSVHVRNVTILGCGDTQPAIARRLEHSRTSITAVDISHQSIRRARLRSCMSFGPISWHTSDIDNFLARTGERSIHHVDAYGVLHHLPHPQSTIAALGRKMAPGSTARVMIYNMWSRQWIARIQQLSRLIGLRGDRQPDTQRLQAMLQVLAKHLPTMSERLAFAIGRNRGHRSSTILVDAFCHVHENHQPLAKWCEWFEQAGLQVMGLLDRHQEMDYLANPLWSPADPQTLDEWAQKGHIRGNWELYLRRPPERAGSTRSPASIPLAARLTVPRLWYQFDELKDLSAPVLWRLWCRQLQCMRDPHTQHHLLAPGLSAAQRLARVGGIVPSMCNPQDHHRLLSPMIPKPQDSTPPERRCRVTNFGWWHQWVAESGQRYSATDRLQCEHLINALAQ